METVRNQIEESIRAKEEMLRDDNLLSSVKMAAGLCVDALKKGRKLLIAGNGGSAADAQHMAGELVNRFLSERPGLSAIALTTDTSVITSVSNDSGFDEIFSRQVEALGKPGDILLLISTSGKSPNILKAAETAKRQKITIIGLTGKTGGDLTRLCDLSINVPSTETPRIQEGHNLIIHIVCGLIENYMFRKSS